MALKEVIDNRLEALRKMVGYSPHLSEDGREELQRHLADLAEKLSNKPVSLSELKTLGMTGEEGLAQFEDKASLKESAADPIEFDEVAIKEWKVMCWLARFDMSEDEMLLLTEKTMKGFISAYGHPAPQLVLQYWRFLVKRWKDIKKAEHQLLPVSCKKAPSEKPTERHAGAVVSSGKMTSQRTEALPEGIEAHNYTPEVASPTAAMWKAKPRTPDGSSRRGTSTATKSIAARSVLSPKSTAARSMAGGDAGASSKPAWSR